MKNTFVTVVALAFLTATASTAKAENFSLQELQPLKKAAVARFIRHANNSKTALGKRINEINKESEDGRNQEGIIAKPINEDDLQVVIVEGENIFALWHYGVKKGNRCTANAASARVRIFLTTEMGVHSASEIGTYVFDMNVLATDSFTTNTGDCDIESSGEAKDYKTVITVSLPTEIKAQQ